jgi:precorrin-3B methylase
MIVTTIPSALVGGESTVAYVNNNDDLSFRYAAIACRLDHVYAKVRQAVVKQIWNLLLEPVTYRFPALVRIDPGDTSVILDSNQQGAPTRVSKGRTSLSDGFKELAVILENLSAFAFEIVGLIGRQR